MIFFLFAMGVAAAIFFGSLLLLEYGRRLGARRLAQEGPGAFTGLNAVEGAVFALMGLLLAFALAGALQRFDDRRQQILQEAAAISTAYDRLDLLAGEARVEIKAKLKDYLKARLELYRLPRDFSLTKGAAVYSSDQQAKILALKAEIWEGAVAACPKTASLTACSLLLPSLNSVFEIARLRTGANERHPPQVIYVMLFGLGLGGSLLAGFGMAAAKTRSWVHMATFAMALAVALYVITDIEFPRLGLITLDYFDHFLDDVYSQML
jgi:hypothetical protein